MAIYVQGSLDLISTNFRFRWKLLQFSSKDEERSEFQLCHFKFESRKNSLDNSTSPSTPAHHRFLTNNLSFPFFSPKAPNGTRENSFHQALRQPRDFSTKAKSRFTSLNIDYWKLHKILSIRSEKPKPNNFHLSTAPLTPWAQDPAHDIFVSFPRARIFQGHVRFSLRSGTITAQSVLLISDYARLI